MVIGQGYGCGPIGSFCQLRCAVFLWLCGLFLIAAATFILLGVPESLITPATGQAVGGDGNYGGVSGVRPDDDGGSTSVTGMNMIGHMYGKLIDVLSLPAVNALLLFLATLQVSIKTTQRNIT